MSPQPPRPRPLGLRRRGAAMRSFVWILILATVIGIGMPWAFKMGDDYGYHRGHRVGLREGYTESTEARTVERKTGVSVRLNTDIDQMLDGLAALGPAEPPEAFVAPLDSLYWDLIAQTARAYAFEPDHRDAAYEAWGALRPQVFGDHHRQLREWMGPLAKPTEAPSRMSLPHYSRAADLRSILKDRACGIVRDTFTVAAGPERGRPLIDGLCRMVDKELLAPWTDELVRRALARDVSETVTSTRTAHQRTIMELATTELEIDGVVRHDYESKLFEGWPIEQTDRATLEVRGRGLVKAGFKMHDQYQVTVRPEEKLVEVSLPRAEILSNTMVPQFSHEKQGWWTSLNREQRNQAIRVLQDNVTAQALKDGILDEAEARAAELVQDLYSPLTNLPGSPYEVRVSFIGERAPIE